MRRSIIAFLTVLLVLFSFPLETVVFAQDNDEIALENELALKIPEETDNPNYNLTFIDPSDKGVFISIDGGKEREITTPYALPSLGIGKHTLSFKYTTAEEQESTYVTEIIVVPRPPQINPPDHSNNKLVVNGTALAGSNVYLFLTGGGESFREIVSLAETTEWEYIFENEFVDGVYTVTAYVTKNGFGSALAEPVTFSIGTTDGNVEEDDVEELGDLNFQLAHILSKDVLNTYKNNTDLILYTVGLILIGLLLGILMHRFLFVRGEKKLEHNFKKMLSGDKDEKAKKGKPDSKKEKDEGETKQEAPPEDQADTGPDGPNANLYEEEFPPFQKNADVEEEVVEEVTEEGGEVTEEAAETEETVEEETVEGEEVEEVVEETAEEETPEDPEEVVEEVVVDEENEEIDEESTDSEDKSEQDNEDEAPDEGEDEVAAESVSEEGTLEADEEVKEDQEEGMKSKYVVGASKTPKEKRKSVFSFLRRDKGEEEEAIEEEKDEKKEEMEQEPTENDSSEISSESETNEGEESEELSREEFLEKFKQHDPDPEEEEKTGSMSEKIVDDAKDDEHDDEAETANEEEEVEENEDNSIENSGLSTRTTNALLEAGYKNVDDLDELDKSDLVNISGIGLVAADEIIAVLRDDKSPSKSKKKTEEKIQPPKKKKPKKPSKKPSRRRNIKISLTSND